MNSNVSAFANNLRALRENAGETQQMLGEAISVTKNAISLYESGKREPNLDTLKRIAAHYGVSVDLLLRTNYYDVDYAKELAINLFDHATTEEYFDTLFPLWAPQTNTDNKYLGEIYSLIHQARDRLLNNHKINEELPKKAMETIMKAHEDGCSEAFFLLPPVIIFEYLFILINLATRRERDRKTTYYDSNYFEQIKAKEEAEIRNAYLQKNRHFLLTSIALLKVSTPKDLGDYYWALIHCLGMGSTDIPLDMESIVGYQMLSELGSMGNKYADKALSNYQLVIEETFKSID